MSRARGVDLFARLMVRAALRSRNPPSPRAAAAMGAAFVAALMLVALETWIGWLDWATADRPPRLPAPPEA